MDPGGGAGEEIYFLKKIKGVSEFEFHRKQNPTSALAPNFVRNANGPPPLLFAIGSRPMRVRNGSSAGWLSESLLPQP